MNVYAIADNIISPLGFTSAENFEHLRLMQTGVQLATHSSLSAEPVYAAQVDNQKLDSVFSSFGNNSDFTPLEKMVIVSVTDALSQNKNIDIKNEKTLLILSTTKGNINLLDKTIENNFGPERVYLWETANVIAKYFENPNQPLVVSNACISGVLALIVAKRVLDDKKFETVVVVGADVLTHFVVSGFQSFKAISSNVAKPYDAARDGISLGEGCGTIILTSNKELLTSGQPAIILAGGASSNDANHISGPSRTGEGLQMAINKTLEEAHISPSEIDYISGHGTATLFNDDMESLAVSGAQLGSVPMNSLKSYFGHTLGAAGIIESIIGLHSMKNNTLIGTFNFSELGVAAPVNIIKETQESRVDNCLKTAAGFGGCNAAVLFRKSDNPVDVSQNLHTDNYITSFCSFQNGELRINNNTDFTNSENISSIDFLKSVYTHYEFNYPKFYKMDNLCKLAFATSELLLKANKITEKYNPSDIAIVIANSSSSLDIDTEHQKAISNKENYFPSPAVFVYTLANILIGEIAIRNKVTGENTFYIFDKFDADFMSSYINSLLNTGRAKCCITGWVEYFDNKYHAFLYTVEKQQGLVSIAHTKEQLINLYTK